MKTFVRRCVQSPSSVRNAALAAVLCMLLGACAHGTASVSGGPVRSTATPWTASTSTFQWNEYGLELIARNAVGQFPALRTHYPMDLDAGFEIGRKVAARALEVGLPKDKPFMPLGQ